jgi:hypothetical protein
LPTPITQSQQDTLDVFSLIDSATVVLGLLENLPTDGLSLSDAEVVTLGLNPPDVSTATDTLALSDNLNGLTLGLIINCSDGITLTDTVTFGGPNISLGLTDTLSLSDSLTAVVGLNILFNETLTLSDVLGSASGYGASFSDTLALSDQIQIDLVGGNFQVSAVDTLVLSDTVGLTLSCLFGFTDVNILSDSTSVAAPFLVSESDTLSLSDHVAFASPITGFNVGDSLLLTERTQLNLQNLYNFQDSFTLTDNVQIHIGFTSLALADSLSLSDSVALNLVFDIQINHGDTLSLADGPPELLLDTDFIDYLRRYLNDVIN